MTPYASFLQNKFVKLIVRLPFRVLLALQNADEAEVVSKEGEAVSDEKIEALTNRVDQLITNRAAFQSKYVKQIFKTVKTQLPTLIAEYRSGVMIGKLDEIEKTVKLIGQLLTLNEINDLIVDFTNFIDESTDFLKETGQNTESKDYQELFEGLKQMFLRCASPTKSLNDLLTELSFQVFFLVADADNVVDKNERAGFQKILKDRDWCSGDFSHLCFAKTEYSYDDLYAQLTNNKLRTDMKEVQRTLRITDQLFKVKEVNLLKIDLYRLSKDIAKASGGIGGIGAISKQEKEVLDVLESYLGDIAAMQLSTAARSSDHVASLIGGDGERSAGKRSVENPAADVGVSVSVKTEMIPEPPVTAVIKTANREFPASVSYISGKGIQCQLEFTEVYVDLSKGASLDLTFQHEKNSPTLRDVRCKTIRNTVLKWDKKLTPMQMKIDWGFYRMPADQQQILDSFIAFCSGQTAS